MSAPDGIGRRLRTGLLAAALLALAACGDSSGRPGAGESAAPACVAPVQGSRYALCGRFSTGGVAAGTDRSVTGAVDAAPGTAAARYHVVGSTFHANR